MASFNISNDGSIGVLYNAGGDINITNAPKPETPEKPPTGLRFQVADPVASFRGRQAQLESVRRAFEEQSNMERYNLVAVCGYGGIGKTEFARKFVKNLRANFSIIWIYSEFESTLCDSFKNLQKELERRGYPCSIPQDVYKHLDSPECLFVFDNAENKKSIAKYLPLQHNKSLFLTTSQYQEWSPHKSVPLDKLDRASAINIMKVVLGRHKVEISGSQLQQLLNSLEPIPLVLQIGVGFVCQEVLGLKSIGKKYNINDIIGELSTDCELVTLEFPDFDENLYDKSVLVALSRTLEKFWNKEDKVSKTAKNMLGVAAYLSADRIHEDILKKLLNMEDQKLFYKSLTILVRFSLFQKSYSTSIFTMHRTVQECVRHLCRKSNPNECYLQSLHVLLNEYYDSWRHHELVIQHAETDFETFRSFYEGNKCRALYETLAKRISCNILQLMLEKTDLINEPKFLCAAATSYRDDLIEKLVKHGANFNVTNSEGLNALYYLCDWSKNLEDTWGRIGALIKVGAYINVQNSQRNTVLHSLCNMGKNCTRKDVDIFEWCALMIKAGGYPTIKNSAGKTPADLAQEHGLPLTQRLLEEAMSGCRCIQHIAARCKLFDTIDHLLDVDLNKICNVEEQDDSGNTVLHVLAGLDPLDAEDVDEIELPYFTTRLMSWRKDIVDVKNKSGETAVDVATRANRLQLVDMFHARSSEISDRFMYDTTVYRQQVEHFFLSNPDRWLLIERDASGGTLLHALCNLDPHGHTHLELELEVIKLVADFVINYSTNTRIRNNADMTAGDVARSRGWRLLADFLNDDDATVRVDRRFNQLSAKLLYVAAKYRQYGLLKYAWWRYCYFGSRHINYFPVGLRSEVLRGLCGCTDSTLTDIDIISALNVLDFCKLVTKYKKEIYQKAIDAANECGRNELTNWLIKTAKQSE